MTRRTRTLLGTIAIILLLVVYPIGIAGFLGDWLASLTPLLSVIVIGILGILWFVPAAIVIRWMSRAD